MKPLNTKVALLVLIALVLSFRPPLSAAGQNALDAAVQTTQPIKWRFGSNEAGSGSYTTRPDGTFEAVTELNILGQNIKSRVTGKMVNGLITEFEVVTQQAGTEVKTSAKDGKAQITRGANSRTVDYKPAGVLFGNLHPALSQTWAKVLDPTKDGVQNIDVFVLDGAATVKVGVTKKKTRTVEADGKKQVANVYLARIGAAEIDVYLTEDGQFAAWDIPSQRLQAVASGREGFLVDPTTLYAELSQPVMTTRAEKAVKIKMRDGVDLVADIVRPADDAKHPVILERTPYGRETLSQLSGEWWAKRGYVHVVQDVRGRNDSDGEWKPFVHERKDGYDTIDWIAKQSWSDGNVGMIGGSYVGFVQWSAAVEAHPALKAIVPQVSPPDPFFNFPIDHGVPLLFGALWWSNYVKDKKVPAVPATPKDIEKLKTLPLSKVDDEVFGRDIPFFNEWLEKQTPSQFAGANFMSDMAKVKIPVLHISGWWDGDGIGTKLNWARMQSLGHKNQWLIYGPWTHIFNSTSRLGDVDYGPEAIMDLDSIYLRFFDTWLKKKQVNWEQPKVRVFVTGINQWRELNDWPDTRSRAMTLFLSSRGPANGVDSVGELVQTGVGRTGTWFFSGSETGGHVVPDIITLAKSLGSGIPVGACLVTDGIAAKIKENDLGTTFGGGMLAMAAVTATLEAIENDGMLSNVRDGESYLRERLSEIDDVRAVRGRGYLLGIEFQPKAADVHQALLQRRVITGTSSDPNVLRLLPPLCLKRNDIDLFVNALRDVFQAS